MCRFSEKWRIIKQVLKSKNSMLITHDEDTFGFDYTGNSMMFGQLFQSIMQYADDWFQNWHRVNSIK